MVRLRLYGKDENSQRHVEGHRAERERTRLNMADRLDMVRAIYKRKENSQRQRIPRVS